MTTPYHIVQGLRAALEARWPGETVYEERCPNEFARPSWLIETGELQLAAMTQSTTTLCLGFTIRAFVQVDAYHDCHFSDLADREIRCVGMLATNMLSSGDRIVRLSGVKASLRGWDYADITGTAEWQELSRELAGLDPENLPMMQDYTLKLKSIIKE